MIEPVLGYAECYSCHHIWNALFPDGIDRKCDADGNIECPKCHQPKGWLLDKENSRYYEEHGE